MDVNEGTVDTIETVATSFGVVVFAGRATKEDVLCLLEEEVVLDTLCIEEFSCHEGDVAFLSIDDDDLGNGNILDRLVDVVDKLLVQVICAVFHKFTEMINDGEALDDELPLELSTREGKFHCDLISNINIAHEDTNPLDWLA